MKGAEWGPKEKTHNSGINSTAEAWGRSHSQLTKKRFTHIFYSIHQQDCQIK